MTPKKLTITDLENVYDQLADAIDQAPESQREKFLVKLALLSAEALGDTEQFNQLTRAALLDL
ncbi:DUF2783 domain-containing protein [Pseudomonas sp. PD9R]|uniref:DUF2783 domain-containing protein n=1 Tax=Pseudomonas sp. PD9R TaxID=2853534 RepID=UPI001C44C2E1|nr:DUF2783 domain-containing protein [Pseudomonas sp. PD9R]MBV6823103.1 DUF2783 domain-containing protein [Pseudomonas sp. PD9R]